MEIIIFGIILGAFLGFIFNVLSNKNKVKVSNNKQLIKELLEIDNSKYDEEEYSLNLFTNHCHKVILSKYNKYCDSIIRDYKDIINNSTINNEEKNIKINILKSEVIQGYNLFKHKINLTRDSIDNLDCYTIFIAMHLDIYDIKNATCNLVKEI